MSEEIRGANSNVVDVYSLGNWDKEADSVSYLDKIIRSTSLFTIYPEITGNLLFMKPHQKQQGMRIDMIISPKPAMVLAGWDRGAIGIECKKSGEKINHAFAQACDYSNTLWQLPNGFTTMCEFSFLWPFPKMGGFAASQMAQCKIGTLSHKDGNWPVLKFFCGESKVIKIDLTNNQVEIGKLNFGNKTGSR